MGDSLASYMDFAKEQPASRPCPECGKPLEFEKSKTSPVGPRWMVKGDTHELCFKKRREELDREDAERQERVRINALFNSCGLPPELVKSKTFENFNVTPGAKRAFDILGVWNPGDDWGVMLQGNVGTGKTHLMIAFAHKQIMQKQSVHFQSLGEMFDSLRAGYNDGSYTQRMDKLKGREVLVLDDVGAEKPNDWVEEKFFQLLDYRISNKLPTFFTTNCKGNELKERLRERITSRIKELAVWVPVTGDDHRNKKYESRLSEIERRLADKGDAIDAASL